MILWHMGVAAVIVYVTLGRRRIDYRFILLGAVLPDLADALASPFFQGDRGPAHSILAVIVVAVVIILGSSGDRRLAIFGIAVGWLLHLVGDGMWESPRIFLWPAFGTALDPSSAEPYSLDLLTHPWDHLSTWAGELVGAAILGWFWVAFRLGEEGRAKDFLRDGYLRP